MGSNYCNRADKEVIVSLAGCVGFADTLMKLRFRNSEQALEEITAMKEHAENAVNIIVDGLDDDQYYSIMRFVNNCQLMVMPNSDVRTNKEYVIVEAKDVETIVNSALSDCSFCEKEGKEAKNCEMRKALIHCGVAGKEGCIDPNCPFKI